MKNTKICVLSILQQHLVLGPNSVKGGLISPISTVFITDFLVLLTTFWMFHFLIYSRLKFDFLHSKLFATEI